MKGFWARLKFLLVMIGIGLSYICFKMWTKPKPKSAGVSDEVEVDLHPTAEVVKKIDTRDKADKK